jgi:hypothetical protein
MSPRAAHRRSSTLLCVCIDAKNPQPPITGHRGFTTNTSRRRILFCDLGSYAILVCDPRGELRSTVRSPPQQRGARLNREIAPAAEGSQAQPCRGVVYRGELCSTMYKESKSMPIIDPPASAVNTLGPRVSEESFHAIQTMQEPPPPHTYRCAPCRGRRDRIEYGTRSERCSQPC